MNFKIDKSFHGLTVEDFFNFYHVGEKYLSLLNKEGVFINDKRVKLDYLINKGDILSFNIKENKAKDIYKGEIKILYEDEDILIVYKDPFMLVHPDGEKRDTLSSRVNYYYPHAKHIHRIDYETSGMVLYGKHFLATCFLNHLMETHKIYKQYILLCHNPFNKLKGEINFKIARDRHENKQRVSKAGKDAKSIYEVIQNGKISRVSVQIIGGRRHQIRVHMAAINHPIVGDKLYGFGDGDRLMLHFSKISFIHPRTLKLFTFHSEPNF